MRLKSAGPFLASACALYLMDILLYYYNDLSRAFWPAAHFGKNDPSPKFPHLTPGARNPRSRRFPLDAPSVLAYNPHQTLC